MTSTPHILPKLTSNQEGEDAIQVKTAFTTNNRHHWSAWRNHVVEEHFADRVVAGAGVTVVENGKESRVELIVENRIGRLANRAAQAGAVSVDLKAGDIELGTGLLVKRRIVKYRRSLNRAIRHYPRAKGKLPSNRFTLDVLEQNSSMARR